MQSLREVFFALRPPSSAYAPPSDGTAAADPIAALAARQWRHHNQRHSAAATKPVALIICRSVAEALKPPVGGRRKEGLNN